MNHLFNKQTLLDRIFETPATIADALMAAAPGYAYVERTGDTIRFNHTASGHTVEVDLPGVKKRDCKVEIVQAGSNVRVYIKASRKIIHKGGQKDETFTREFTLSETRQENVSAKLEDGVLTVTAPVEVNQVNKKTLELT